MRKFDEASAAFGVGDVGGRCLNFVKTAAHIGNTDGDRDGGEQRRVVRRITDERGAGYIEKLRSLGDAIAMKYPQVRVSADQPYRLTDLAIDYAEQSHNVRSEIVTEIAAWMRTEGYQTAVSSIHIHAYKPENQKADGVYPLMHTAFAMDQQAVHARVAFIGDSPNDASLFTSIPVSVGVANVRGSLDKIQTPPAYVTDAECGAGFIEFAQRLIAARA